MYCIPLYEILTYPCQRSRSPCIVKSIGIVAAAVNISSMYGVIVEITRQVTTSGLFECTIFPGSEIIPINILVGLMIVLHFKCTTEFICALAPYNMEHL